MLERQTVFDWDGLQIGDIACRHPRGRGKDEEAPAHGVAFVRRGCFIHSIAGEERLLDPSSVYFFNPGDEVRYDHPNDGGDDCTALLLSPQLLASVWGGEPDLPAAPFHCPSQLDLEQRLLLAAARGGADPDQIGERAIVLLAATLELSNQPRVQSGRPASISSRRRLVEAAQEALAADTSLSLSALARQLATSPHHLSRIFRLATGHTLSRHRMRLRARAALERLAEGEHDLARLAADLGFADQSHLCRVIRSETGSTPSALRRALGAADEGGIAAPS